ncbi:hypothetical protein GCM10008967_09260 [Bacillus carboniphilus]|uniref:Uncharacterized protein n=1 Tax=Bacillus carboniphilus TaxID=86663 RepID=A0ABN0VYY4_9BACI
MSFLFIITISHSMHVAYRFSTLGYAWDRPFVKGNEYAYVH